MRNNLPNRLSLRISFLFVVISGLLSSCSNPEGEVGSTAASTSIDYTDFFDIKKGIPQPDPTPIIKKIRISRPPIDHLAPVFVVGLPNTISPDVLVLIANGPNEVMTKSSTDGSFAATIPAQAGDLLSIEFHSLVSGGPIPSLDPVAVQLPSGGKQSPPSPPPSAIDGTPPIIRLTAKTVAIEGKTIFEPGSIVIAVNVTAFSINTAVVNESQTFSLEARALSGDQIQVYDDQSLLESPWNLVAP
jgi:hypothetical protein